MQTPWIPCTTAGPNFNVPPKKEAEKSNQHLKLDFDCGQRDGLYDDEQMYAIYSKEEIIELSKAISECKGI